MLKVHLNGDNHIQNFHLGRYNVGHMVGNLVLRRRIIEYSYPLIGRVGVIKIVIVINCNLITFSKVIACNCN